MGTITSGRPGLAGKCFLRPGRGVHGGRPVPVESYRAATGKCMSQPPASAAEREFLISIRAFCLMVAALAQK